MNYMWLCKEGVIKIKITKLCGRRAGVPRTWECEQVDLYSDALPSPTTTPPRLLSGAKNPWFPSVVLEDSNSFNVHWGGGAEQVQWFHNGEELYHNVSAGIIQSNQSLVLQKVTRKSSGQYTCSATNLHGTGGSNAVQLSVKFAPLCRAGQKVVYGGGKHEEINVTCSVEAHPEPKSFRWAFNTSSEMVDIPSSRIWVVGKGRSQASYTPRTHLDYGSLLCWANNDVGRQQNPCIFHIIHAASPEPVNNCTVENVSSTG
ncbi:carcinoembryonic antigen-related cell adhesion molecule 1-like, partial [Penaeus vannamei]|uniref:carcinoembryonic antigen-related cell adhesion molecule 1-like n=1 Tax=Penaeus vannamei TaxID=6689 RepID=UPI00387F7015